MARARRAPAAPAAPAALDPAADLEHVAEPLRGLALPIAGLVFDPANARRHGTRNLEAICASLRRFGQRKPLVVRREGMIVEAGNGTLEAARALGWTHLACVVVDDDATSAAGFGIADNRSAELAEWDDDALASLLESLRAEDVLLADLGWDEADLTALLGDQAPTPAPGDASADDQADLDKLSPLLCPHCGRDTRAAPDR